MFEVKTSNICPLCNKASKKISSITIKSMIKQEYKKNITKFGSFYFCNNPYCSIVYFKNKKVIKENEVIKKVAIKEWVNPKIICYCFNLTKEKLIENILLHGKNYIFKSIKNKINKSKCNCEKENPSGKCCLNDIQKIINELKFIS